MSDHADQIIAAGEKYADARAHIQNLVHRDGVTDWEDERMAAAISEHARTYMEFCKLAYGVRYGKPPACFTPFAADQPRRTADATARALERFPIDGVSVETERA